MATLNFDANDHEPTGSFEPIPAGKYPVVVESSETKPYNSGPGEYLKLTLQIIDGHYKGRKLFDNLNLDHPNKTTVEIAQRQLSALCHATKVMKPSDSTQLHDIAVMAEVKVTPAKGDYGPGNKIQTYKALDAGGVAPQVEAPAADGAAKPPWGG